MNDIHSCGPDCERPECVKAQRDELRAEVEWLRAEAERAWRETDVIAKERDEHMRWRRELADKLHDAESRRTVTLLPMPEPRGYMTPAGLRAMERDESTCLVRKHPYLIEDPQGMFTADQMRDYAIAALRAAGAEVAP